MGESYEWVNIGVFLVFYFLLTIIHVVSVTWSNFRCVVACMGFPIITRQGWVEGDVFPTSDLN